MSRLWRAYHPGAGGEVEIVLGREESHHVARVLRLGPGDPLGVFDGIGGEWQGIILSAERVAVRVRLMKPIDAPVEPGVRVVLFQGLCRTDRMEWLIQKATEVGMGALQPVLSVRADAPAPSVRRLERWRRIALEACKQCGRRVLPDIGEPSGLPGSAPPGVRAILLDSGTDAPPLRRHLTGTPAGEVWLAVGPERGFDRSEALALRERGWLPASLGPRVLRAETAGAIGCSVVLHLWADLA